MSRPLLLCLAAGISCASWALDAKSVGADLFVNESRVFTFQTPQAGVAATLRAARVAAVLSALRPGSPLRIAGSGGQRKVLDGKHLILVLSEDDARAAQSSLASLAEAFVARVAEAAALPPLKADTTSVTLPPDRPAKVALVGSAAAKSAVSASRPGIVSVVRSTGSLTLKPVAVGETTLEIVSGAEALHITVAVLPYAFDVSHHWSVRVVGNPAGTSVVAGAAVAEVQSRGSSVPGVQVWAKALDAAALGTGIDRWVKVRVKATGPGAFPFEGECSVHVANVGVGVSHEDELWYSNNPERIPKPKRLYWAELKAGRSARLLYHHINDYTFPVVVRYLVANPTAEPALVTLSLGDSRPDRNPTRAGYVAGDQFLSKWLSGSAEVVELPPNTTIPITLRRIAPGETMSGLATLSLLKGGPESVVVVGDSVLPQVMPAMWSVGLGVTGAWHAAPPLSLGDTRMNLTGSTEEVYPKPFREARLDYEVGGRFGFARIGDNPVLDSTTHKELKGNFGVIYDIKGELKNPTAEPVEVELLLEASAGYGSALFVLNGDYIRVGMISPKSETVLASIKLPPGSSKPLSITTLPLSGANYPVTLVVRPTGIELARHHSY